ncbi:MAG TPA: dual specificity protein phosphatase family protein [Solirubrobacteraceae bacterium]|nr:dual specificity protein phosphatase family protein [Solirubrobacteraceae bacterium]
MSSWFRTYGFAEILPELVIGALPRDAEDVSMLEWVGIERVLNLVEDREYAPGERAAAEAAYGASRIEEYRLEFTDFGNLGREALGAAVEAVVEWLGSGAKVYIHCRAGWQRSAVVAAGVLAVTRELSADDALAFVGARKPSADPLPHQRKDLERWLAERAPQSGST